MAKTIRRSENSRITTMSDHESSSSLNQKILSEQDLASDQEQFVIDVPTAFKQTGGVGRFQLLMLIAMCLNYNSGNFLYFGFPYLTQE